MKALLLRLFAGLVAGALGFYGGLLLLVASTGLGRPEWAPIVMLAGAGLAGFAAVAAISGLPAGRVAVWAGVGALSGTLLGLLLADARDAFEWTIVGGLSLIVIAAFAADTRRLV